MSADLPNWFEMSAKGNFEKFLHWKRGFSNYHALQIGAFAGHASEWLLRNVLTGKGSYLHDVDTWEGSNERAHKLMDWKDVEETYRDRIRSWMWTSKHHAFKMTSDQYFAQIAADESFVRADFGYDFIYIDGDHTAAQVYRDGVNAWRWLKPGGLIAFDDYEWRGHPEPELCPKQGIDRFLHDHAGLYTIREKGYQVWIRKS